MITKSINLLLIETRLVESRTFDKRFLSNYILILRVCTEGNHLLLLFDGTTLFGSFLLLADFMLNFRDWRYLLGHSIVGLLICFPELFVLGFRLSSFWLVHLPAELGLFLISLELLAAKISELVTCAGALATTLAGVCFFSLVAAAT